MIGSLIQFTAHPSVQRRWGEWLRPRDEPSPAGTDGAMAQSGGDARLSARTVYMIGILLIAFSAVVGTFSSARYCVAAWQPAESLGTGLMETFAAGSSISSASWRWKDGPRAISRFVSTAAKQSPAAAGSSPPSPASAPADRCRAAHAHAVHLAFLLSGPAGRATPHGSYFSLGSGIRSSAAL